MTTRNDDAGQAPRTPRRGGDTPMRILDSAERLVQARGFNGFSYAESRPSSASPRPASTITSRARRSSGTPDRALRGAVLRGARAHRRRASGAPAKLDAYADLYADVLHGDRMCLCGMLAAEYGTLPKPIRERVTPSSTSTSGGSSACSSRDAPTAACACRRRRETPLGSSWAPSKAPCSSRAPTATPIDSTPRPPDCSRADRHDLGAASPRRRAVSAVQDSSG